ncbi:MAG: alpha/beta hydrolase [Steroidobacteraceae bacterium]
MTRPARAEPISIDGPAGPLEALLEQPEVTAGAGFAVICHPHPLHGGSMHNKVVYTLARACQERGLSTLRFNYRGVGASAGRYDNGRGETDDALAVVASARTRWPGAALTLAGFSFGAMVSLGAAASAAPARLISVAPAVTYPEFERLPRPQCPWLIVQGEADEVVRCVDVQAFAARFQPPPRLVVLPGVGHFFHGRLPELRDAAIEFLASSDTVAASAEDEEAQ